MKAAFDFARPFDGIRNQFTVGGLALELYEGAWEEEITWRLQVYTDEMAMCLECCYGADEDLNERLSELLAVVRDCETVADCPVVEDSDGQLAIDTALALHFIHKTVAALQESAPLDRTILQWDSMSEACREAGTKYILRLQDDEGEVRSRNARAAAEARHSSGPYAEAREFARDCWQKWQQNPSSYRSVAQFARDMRDKFPDLIANPVTEPPRKSRRPVGLSQAATSVA